MDANRSHNKLNTIQDDNYVNQTWNYCGTRLVRSHTSAVHPYDMPSRSYSSRLNRLFYQEYDPKKKNHCGDTYEDLFKDAEDFLQDQIANSNTATKRNVARVQRQATKVTVNGLATQGLNLTPISLADCQDNLGLAMDLSKQGTDMNVQITSEIPPLKVLPLADFQPTNNQTNPKSQTSSNGTDKDGACLSQNHVITTTSFGCTNSIVPTLSTSVDLTIPTSPLVVSTSSNSRSSVIKRRKVEPVIDLTLDEENVVDLTVSQLSKRMISFLDNLELGHLKSIFEREEITPEILAEMGHEELKQIGVNVYANRHKLIKEKDKLFHSHSNASLKSEQSKDETEFLNLSPNDKEYKEVEGQFLNTNSSQQVQHNHSFFGISENVRFCVTKIQKIRNKKLWDRYCHRRQQVAEDNDDQANERMLFHGSPKIDAIVQQGFDERHARIGGLFGAGLYFADNSAKSNNYVKWGAGARPFGSRIAVGTYGGLFGFGTICQIHNLANYHVCSPQHDKSSSRQMLLCRVTLGKSIQQFGGQMAHAPPGYHSVTGQGRSRSSFREYVVYRGEQAYPEYLIDYQVI